MQFTKMHGAGNDYIFVNCFSETVPDDLTAVARAVSDRNCGVGADGLILICPSDSADAKMRMFNADGSEAEMCGNGIRCVAKYLFERSIVTKNVMTIETGKGIQTLELFIEAEQVQSVRVNMGPPILEAEKIPTTLTGNPPINVLIDVAEKQLSVNCVSMGNPHCVLFSNEPLTDDLVQTLGPAIESHAAFPNRVNVGFAQIISTTEINLRVWERGSGETQACGSGACAAAVCGILAVRLERSVLCHLPGGDLEIQWGENPGDVYLSGPAGDVFSGGWAE